MAAPMSALQWLRVVLWVVSIGFIFPIGYCTFRVLFYPLKFISPKAARTLNFAYAHLINLSMAAVSELGGFEVVESGADVRALAGRRCLVLVNHQSHADHFPLLAANCCTNGAAANPMWLVFGFNALLAIPLGWCWAMHGNFYVLPPTRCSQARNVQRLRAHVRRVYWPQRMGWLLLYPEGSILPNCQRKSLEAARRLGLREFEHSALPRPAAVHAALDTVRQLAREQASVGPDAASHPDGFEKVIDITMAYGTSPPTTGVELMRGLVSPLKFQLHYRLYDAACIPADSEDAVFQWLYDRWVEKEDMLTHFRSHGCFPGEPTERSVRMPRALLFGGLLFMSLSGILSIYLSLKLVLMLVSTLI